MERGIWKVQLVQELSTFLILTSDRRCVQLFSYAFFKKIYLLGCIIIQFFWGFDPLVLQVNFAFLDAVKIAFSLSFLLSTLSSFSPQSCFSFYLNLSKKAALRCKWWIVWGWLVWLLSSGQRLWAVLFFQAARPLRQGLRLPECIVNVNHTGSAQ